LLITGITNRRFTFASGIFGHIRRGVIIQASIFFNGLPITIKDISSKP
jgi:hypothetical protein